VNRHAQSSPGRETGLIHARYLRATPGVRDVVAPAGTYAKPWAAAEAFVATLGSDNIRENPAGSTALWGCRSLAHDEVRAGRGRLGETAAGERSVHLDPHPCERGAVRDALVAKATGTMLDTGIRDVRNQGRAACGVNDSASRPCGNCPLTLLDGARHHCPTTSNDAT